MRTSPVFLLLCGIASAILAGGQPATALTNARQSDRQQISILAEGEIGEPASFAARELAASLRAKNLEVRQIALSGPIPEGAAILIGLQANGTRLGELQRNGKLAVPASAEAFALTAAELEGRRIAVAAGSDSRGLMYALLELARRIEFLDSHTPVDPWLRQLRPESGRPAVPSRGMIQFLHSADLERSWYYDREYWENYLGMLARDRFNSFNLVFAHQTSYLAPPYPFLFDVEEHPQVKVPGLSAADQARNLQTLQMISRMARERGIDFIMGIWEQRAWRRGQTSMVDGLSDEVLVDYARLAMRKLLRLCPDITGIQLRVNNESGIDNPLQTRFYRDGILAGMKAAGRPVLLDLRGWGALPDTIDASIKSGLPLRVSAKYWAEFMGMPYQAAAMLPSYSYGDFLRYPRLYPMLYQVWSLGSHRLLPWGSVDWMKRFVPTTLLGDGIGFETCAPLSQKGFGNAPGDWHIFTSPEREYYRWEFQRYWLYYLLYGRLSYDPGTSEDVWMDEFRARFGRGAAPDLFDAFQSASEIIPFLSSYRLSNANMYIWPEKQMGGILDFFLEVKPADPERFADFEEYAGARLRGERTAKMMPEEAARRLSRWADDTERALARAGTSVKAADNREFAANGIDLNVLATLARYHARKILAAANLGLFYKTGDESVLRIARSQAAAGLEVWERLVRLTDGVYFPNMAFGPLDVGHWKDNLVFVRHDVARLDEVKSLLDRYELFDLGLDFGPKVEPRRSAYEPQYANSYSVERRFRLLDNEMTYSPQRGYGWRQTAGLACSPPMRIPLASLEGDNLEDLALPSAVLTADYLKSTSQSALLADLPDGEYRVTSIVANQPEIASGAFRIRAVAADGQSTGEINYGLAETGDKTMDVRVSGNRLQLDFIPQAGADWLVSALTITRRAPHIAHVPLAGVLPGSRVVLETTITAPDGVAGANLRIDVEGEKAPLLVPLRADGRTFSAGIEWPGRWAGRRAGYFITATDKRGKASRWPASGAQRVQIGHDAEGPVISHEPVRTCTQGQPVRLALTIRDASEIAAARLHYRHLTQKEKYQVVDLVCSGQNYTATIPGDFVTADYDLMYFVEAVDSYGNGTIYPDPDRAAPYIVVKLRTGN